MVCDLPSVTKTEKRLSTIVSMIASISVSFTSPLFMAEDITKDKSSNCLGFAILVHKYIWGLFHSKTIYWGGGEAQEFI